jgi:hypothetical protein
MEPGMKEPPKLALRLLNLFVPASEAESIPGDLVEEFQAMAGEKSAGRANRWFWAQVVRSLGAMAWMDARTALRRTAGAVLSGLLVLGIGAAASLALFREMVLYLLRRYGFNGDPPVTVNLAMAGILILVPVVCCAGGAYISARLAKGSGVAAVLALGLALTLVLAIWTRAGFFPASEPLAIWQAALVLLGAWPSLLAGGYLRVRQLRASHTPARAA